MVVLITVILIVFSDKNRIDFRQFMSLYIVRDRFTDISTSGNKMILFFYSRVIIPWITRSEKKFQHHNTEKQSSDEKYMCARI